MKLLKRIKKPSIEEVAKEPTSLGLSASQVQTKINAVPVLLIVGSMFLFLFLGNQGFFATPEQAGVGGFACLGGGLVALIFINMNQVNQASSHHLYIREHIWTESLISKYEEYFKPADVRRMLRVDQEGVKESKEANEVALKKLDEFIKKVAMIDPNLSENVQKKLREALGESLKKNPHIYYFHHPKTKCQGWDRTTHKIKEFTSEFLFLPKPKEETYSFSQGSCNLYGFTLLNHPNAVNDAVLCLGWTHDPFTGQDMPIEVLIHTSRTAYKPSSLDFVERQAWAHLSVVEYGVIQAQRKEMEEQLESLSAKDDHVEGVVKLGRRRADQILKFHNESLSLPGFRWLKGTWAKVILTLLIIVGVLIGLGMWLGFIKFW